MAPDKLTLQRTELIVRTQFGPFGAFFRPRYVDEVLPGQRVAGQIMLTYRADSPSSNAQSGIPSLAPVHDQIRRRIAELTADVIPVTNGEGLALWLHGHLATWMTAGLAKWGGRYALERVDLGLVEAVGPAGAPKHVGRTYGDMGHEAAVTWYSVEVPQSYLIVHELTRATAPTERGRALMATVAPIPELTVHVVDERPGVPL